MDRPAGAQRSAALKHGSRLPASPVLSGRICASHTAKVECETQEDSPTSDSCVCAASRTNHLEGPHHAAGG